MVAAKAHVHASWWSAHTLVLLGFAGIPPHPRIQRPLLDPSLLDAGEGGEVAKERDKAGPYKEEREEKRHNLNTAARWRRADR